MSNRRDDLIEKYAADIKGKFDQTPDMDLLKKVTIGLGPAIYNMDSSKVSGSDEAELETVRKNFLIKKLFFTKAQRAIDGGWSCINGRHQKRNGKIWQIGKK